MDSPLSVINKLMTEIFNDILTIEQNAIRADVFDDVTISEIHTVEAVGLHDRLAMSEIARKLHITVGTLTVAITNLVKKGYVERFKCDNDRRVVKISLTKKGRVLYRAHYLFHSKAAKESINGLTDEEVNALTCALDKVHKFLVRNYITTDMGDS